MLKTLQIKDYALIENIQVEFGKGLNIITGETGAGKSILIDAMGLLLGERASTEVVRKGANKSIVEGIFDVKRNKRIEKFLTENEIDFNEELIVRREVSLKGTNRCFLNDTPVTLNLIKDAGDLLVDLHGQHEHQSLLKTDMHIEMLDEFGDLNSTIEKFQEISTELASLQKELRVLYDKENLIKEKQSLYEFQAKEIDQVSPVRDEEGKLLEELKILENSERLVNITNDIYNSIYEDEGAVQDNVAAIKNKLTELSNIDKSFTEKLNECETALTLLNDIAAFVRSYKEKIEIEPERLEIIRERLGAINLLKKKFGGSLNYVLEYREKIEKELELAVNFCDKISSLEKQINQKRIESGNIAKEISSKRKTISKKVKKEVEDSLKYLGIQNPSFDIKIQNIPAEKDSDNYIIIDSKKYKYNRFGYDEVEFYVSTNIGEDLKPLVKVASGGEISRIMLGLKSILAKSDLLPILIFDEIDTGVSGRIAQKVGEALKSLAQYHQIIAITHLPQIAALSDIHFAVEKKQIGERVVSSIKNLPMGERINEIAKLLSGEKISGAAVESAKELMGLLN